MIISLVSFYEIYKGFADIFSLRFDFKLLIESLPKDDSFQSKVFDSN